MLSALAALNSPAPAHASAEHVIAVFVASKGNVPSNWIDAVRAQLVEHPAALPSGRVLAGATLSAALDTEAEQAGSACGPSVTCLAGLGKKAGAESVLYTRLVETKTGITVQCLIINVLTADIADKTAFDVKTIESVPTLVDANLVQIFPEAAKPRPEATVSQEPKPAAAPGPEPTIVFDFDNPAPVPEGEGPRKITRAELFQEFAVDDPHANGENLPAAVDTGVMVPARDADKNEGEPIFGPAAFLRAWRYTSLGLFGAGLVGIGVGAILGATARSENNSIQASWTQLRARQMLDKANTNVSRANDFYGVGGVLAALGGAGLGLEYFYWGF